jgi:adenylylsulfate kinase
MQVRHESKPEGFVLWMTGLPGSGKSTLAQLLAKQLRDDFGRNVEVLDGDEIRKGLSRDLGLSKEDREEHNHRVSYVAKVLSRNGVIVISALIAPYRSSRALAKEMIGPERFLETYIKAPLDVCEKRDPKGLYAKARKGEINNMTGIQDPYEVPESPDIVVGTERCTPEESVAELVEKLMKLGFVRGPVGTTMGGQGRRRGKSPSHLLRR